MNLEITPLATALGAEVRGADLAHPDNETTDAILTALDKYLVLVIRKQHLSPVQYLEACRQLGPLMAQHLTDYLMPEHPEIAVLDSRKTRVGPDGNKIALGARDWHTDHTNHARPPKYTVLYALALPPTGGDTGFANMQTAYETLDVDTQAHVKELRTVNVIENHSYVSDDDKARFGQAQVHPFVRTHPGNGKKGIYVHPGKLDRIDGLEPAESHQFVNDLLERCLTPAITYRHQWQVGDMLVCDNRAVMHIAYRDYDLSAGRLMHRVIVEGEVPY